jgi:hypothetical protein
MRYAARLLKRRFPPDPQIAPITQISAAISDYEMSKTASKERFSLLPGACRPLK